MLQFSLHSCYIIANVFSATADKIAKASIFGV